MEASLGRRLAAEFVGTALLVLFGAGSVVGALTLGGGELSYAGLGFIALAFAVVIAVVVYGFGPISGAHINPAVTFSLAVSRVFSWAETVPYVVAQLTGGAAGGLLIVAAFGTDAADLGGVGGTALGEGVSYGSGIVAEAIGTFLLVFTVMALAVDPRAPQGWAGLMIGLSVACAIFVIGPLTGGSLNPARTFGPNVAAEIFGGSVSWSQFPLYWIGPFIGGAVAVLVYQLVARPHREAPSAEDATGGAVDAESTSELRAPGRSEQS
ncbi:MAG: MIP family channel protein [Propionibacteriales bacterium]|nr:MIP family channel protein [Propionibacteriales bacterium]